VDVAPTVLAMVNVPPPPGYEGLALREVAGVGDDRPVVAQSVRWGSEQQAVRIGQFKLIRDWNRNERIFDLRSDPSEVRALDAGLDLVERELAKHLGAPDSGAAWLHAESPGARLGAFLVDRWRRTPWGAAAQ
jgi:arylsulfatase A-like enzyme